jgi:protein MpaA
VTGRWLVVVVVLACALGVAPGAAAPGPAVVAPGRSAAGRPIPVVQTGDVRAATRVLVFGAVHGDETAGIAIAERLAHLRAPLGVAVWVVPDLNPDGRAAGTRQNARGVDLNRNFPYRWRPIGHRGDQQYSGRGPLSEPEARYAASLIEAIDPTITIWFHQPLGIVDRSGGDPSVERRFGRLAHLRVTRLLRYPGSATGWANHRRPLRAAFVVELPGGPLRARRAAALALAVLSLASWRQTRLPATTRSGGSPCPTGLSACRATGS